jgi:uncharacterized protein YbaR (Trm112 family)
MGLDVELLKILACPACKSDVRYDEEKQLICCTNPDCRRKYPVRDGIPVMLVEESTQD